MTNIESLGVQVPQVYLPRRGADLTRWAVIACDQFTSQPEYWREVESIVAASPSTYRMILPEIYLGTSNEVDRINSINGTMERYLSTGILQPRRSMIYIERAIGAKTRKGLLLCLDLEKYDFHKGSGSLIRSTEETIVERLPPRIKIRKSAPLELPHILVLIDDPGRTVIEPLAAEKTRLAPLYDFDLMLDSGHLAGYGIEDAAIEDRILSALEGLSKPETFRQKYGVGVEQPVLLFAMGDGNHSLATAKAVWEEIKPSVGMEHPARFALVEIENLHDAGLTFEPIHRLVYGLRVDLLPSLRSSNYGFELERQPDLQTMLTGVIDSGNRQVFGIITGSAAWLVKIGKPSANLAVGTLQAFLDRFMQAGSAQKIDYVHDEDTVCRLGALPGNAGFILPAMPKEELFRTVILDGALPRKTFSMGEAREKRFYMECRKIVL